VEVRIGITQARELEIELADDADPEALSEYVSEQLANDNAVLWLTDRRGRKVGVPVAKVAFVEIGSPADTRRIGFSS